MPYPKSEENKKKLSKVYKICNGLRKRNHMSDEKVERCVMGISKRWGITKSKMSKKKKKKS